MPWFGKPGALVALPAPAPGVDAVYEQDATVQPTLGGGRIVQYPGVSGAHVWHLAWEGLTHDEWALLHAYSSRQRGYGPWIFYLAPNTRWNLLTPNQASGTDQRCDTTGFTVTGGESLVSSTALAYTGTRSLRWSLPASVTSGLLTYTPPRGLLGWPTPAGQAWAAAAQFRIGAGTDTTFDVRMTLRWLDAAGALLSTTTGTYTAGSTSAWTRVSVTGTAPANTVYVEPRAQVDATDVSAAALAHLDELTLEMAAAVDTWLPGVGVPRVSIASMPHSLPLASYHAAEWLLQEVSA